MFFARVSREAVNCVCIACVLRIYVCVLYVYVCGLQALEVKETARVPDTTRPSRSNRAPFVVSYPGIETAYNSAEFNFRHERIRESVLCH